MVDESSVGALLTSIHDLALLVLEKVKVFVVLVNALHALVTLCLRDHLATVLNDQVSFLDRSCCLNTESTFLSLLFQRSKI